MFSFLNDEHERAYGERRRLALPEVPVFLSSEVLPEIREFERTSTTAVCAYVAPILESYLRKVATTPQPWGTAAAGDPAGVAGAAAQGRTGTTEMLFFGEPSMILSL